MVIRKITLSQFRNVALATLELRGPRQFLVGPNGQGKTNLIEAAGYISALRSFRTSESGHLIRHGGGEAAVRVEVDREGSGAESLVVRIRAEGKSLWRNDKRTTRLADHLGQFPTVTFSSEDLQLVRGSPALRRRWLDLALSAMDPVYLAALQAYSGALAARNNLLRRRDPGLATQIAAFEQAMAPSGARIIELRTAGIAELDREMARGYRALSGGEEARLAYEPCAQLPTAEGLLAALVQARGRDLQAGTTTLGPHRDDLRFDVRSADARSFASEGQQRTVTLALRLAQAGWYRSRCGVVPVLLADDVLGELDGGRRERFWASLDPSAQVIATGTALPGPGDWQVFSVADGTFAPEDRGMEASR